MSEKETILKVNPEQKTEVKLKGLTKLQAKLLRAGKLPLVALAGILGGAVYGRSGSRMNMGIASETNTGPSNDFASDQEVTDETQVDEVELDDVEIEGDSSEGLVNLTVSSNVQFADAVSDDMSFGEAFDTAREQLGGGGFFMWKGQPYSTYTKEEWDSFSSDQKKEFFEAFKEQSDFENAEEEPTDIDSDIDPEVDTEVEADDTTEDTDENTEEETEIEPENKSQTEVEPDQELEPEEVEPELEPEEVTPDEQPEEVEPDLEPEDALPDEEPEEVEPDAEDIEVEDEFVDLDELGSDDEIIEGLNDGEAFDEEDSFGEDFDI